jgi:ATP-dependent NAD(P)H-hydrate dehydratase
MRVSLLLLAATALVKPGVGSVTAAAVSTTATVAAGGDVTVAVEMAAAASGAARLTELLTALVIPSFRKSAHKGSHGKVLVIGGSFEYTGAPYYAGIAALKTGADLAYVACAADAAVAIKAYSPELIVHPVLPNAASVRAAAAAAGGGDAAGPAGGGGSRRNSSSSGPGAHAAAAAVADGVAALVALLERADSVVIGPGLGRDPTTLEVVGRLLPLLGARGVPTVIDGDGLWLLAQSPGLVAGHPSAVLTPNAVEFKRLWDATTATAAAAGSAGSASGSSISASSSSSSLGLSSGGSEGSGDPHDHTGEAVELARRLGPGVAVVRKGTRDVVVCARKAGNGSSGHSSTGSHAPRDDTVGAAVAVVSDPSSPRRCGGQGDALAGSLGTFLAWAARARLIGPAAAAAAAPAGGGSDRAGSGPAPPDADAPLASSPADVLVACGYGAALLTRTAASYAFEAHRRATTTPDVIARLGPAFEDAFQDHRSGGGR